MPFNIRPHPLLIHSTLARNLLRYRGGTNQTTSNKPDSSVLSRVGKRAWAASPLAFLCFHARKEFRPMTRLPDCMCMACPCGRRSGFGTNFKYSVKQFDVPPQFTCFFI
jgi:hypothetical protein